MRKSEKEHARYVYKLHGRKKTNMLKCFFIPVLDTRHSIAFSVDQNEYM